MRRIVVSVARQKLELYNVDKLEKEYLISTSRNGCGEVENSFKTPRGSHVVRAKIGEGLAENAVLRGRRPTGEIVTDEMMHADPDKDWIVSRILWLSGCEVGRNRLGKVDTMARYIYIHGTPHVEQLGTPGSLGCVRMSSADVIDLYKQVPVGTEVVINEGR